MYDRLQGWKTIIREQPATLSGALRLYDAFAYPTRRLTWSRSGIGEFNVGDSLIKIDDEEVYRLWGNGDASALLGMHVESGFFQNVIEHGILPYMLANLFPSSDHDPTLVRFEENKIHVQGSRLGALELSKIVRESLDAQRTSRSIRRFLRTCA